MITNYLAKCDMCKVEITFNDWPFKTIIDHIKKQGWKIFRTGSLYYHHCEKCANPEFKSMGRPTGYWWQND